MMNERFRCALNKALANKAFQINRHYTFYTKPVVSRDKAGNITEVICGVKELRFEDGECYVFYVKQDCNGEYDGVRKDVVETIHLLDDKLNRVERVYE